jgi:Helix-turn-helix domain
VQRLAAFPKRNAGGNSAGVVIFEHPPPSPNRSWGRRHRRGPGCVIAKVPSARTPTRDFTVCPRGLARGWPRSPLESGRSIESSPRQLARCFKESTGRTQVVYQQKLQLELAGVLLQDPALTLDVIAARFGFADARSVRQLWLKEHGLHLLVPGPRASSPPAVGHVFLTG